ncbi:MULTISPECIES: fumarylacetoacetate hydrolase family protein [Rhizobium/Agrobacterium group]|uniref:fumarylacetoacetate hydrolase family protein n=1 Tax=Rhizobium/Agrobacterium group TaxID=227290 RepID=UPI000B3FF9F8|nr:MULTISPECIES: fumarylacetoacetate hydrolase family protein [Rhizobium/Agrobacterium group]MCF1480675.1 fumarylacetoacetate hydrolase family protein [Allorhizobium ampelinum]MVA60345.1 5-carboxymethyl-2-hydroxymuconate isomerase [Agrobacterium vitis]NSZ44527.1 fumarylacetoacetate hydrolase family protein [Agrobacterium vitis]NTA28274.1 fumarylacetoacetate hydrolase family protein [Allorhizobium ampelinum]OVE92915.1 5-carboxymethyl-2-hydroxymuconate isomerase [Allorhizobium ampelinum]
MKFVSFTRLGRAGFGAVVGGGIVDLTGRLSYDCLTLKQAILDDLLEIAADYAGDRKPELAFSDVTLLPVIPDPGKILCIGVNYVAHREETKRPEVGHPTVFIRFADSQIGHGQPMIKPSQSDCLDFEAELAVVIGRGGRDIAEEDAMQHIAGYSCYHDGSVRDWQRHSSQFAPGKNFPATGAFGPALVTTDEVEDYTQLSITGRLNGQVVQQATLADLIFPIPALIAYLSAFTPLSAGDVIVTGTPGGVGERREPPLFMKAGDVFEVDIPGVGLLVNPVIGAL